MPSAPNCSSLPHSLPPSLPHSDPPLNEFGIPPTFNSERFLTFPPPVILSFSEPEEFPSPPPGPAKRKEKKTVPFAFTKFTVDGRTNELQCLCHSGEVVGTLSYFGYHSGDVVGTLFCFGCMLACLPARPCRLGGSL